MARRPAEANPFPPPALPPLGPSLVVDDVVEVDAAMSGPESPGFWSRGERCRCCLAEVTGVGDDVVEVHAASRGSRIAGVADDVVGVDAERGPEVCAISVIRQRAETENSAFANIDDTVEDAQADIARGVQRAASRVDITLDNAIGDELPLRP